MSNQSRFVKMIIDGELVVAKKKKKELVAELRSLKFKPFPKVIDARKEGEFEAVVEPVDDREVLDADVETAANDYDYLLGVGSAWPGMADGLLANLTCRWPSGR